MKKNIYIAILNLKKKKNLLILSVLTFLLCLMFLLISFSWGINSYLYNLIYHSIDNRSLDVEVLYDALTEEDLLKMDYITSVTKFNSRKAWFELGKYKSVQLFAIEGKEYDNLKVVHGNKELGDYSIICPTVFVPATDPENHNDVNENTYTTKNLLNEEFDVELNRIESIIDEEKLTLEHKILDSKVQKFKIVGTYNNKDYGLSSDTCFILKDDLQSLIDYTNANGDDYSGYSVLVDNITNKSKVKKNLEKKQCFVTEVLHIDMFSYFVISIISVGIFLLIIFAIAITIKLIIKRDLKMREEELLVYKCIGYTKKDIKQIYSFEYLVVLILAVTFSIVFGSIIMNMVLVRYNAYIVYNALDFSVNFLSYLVVFVIGIGFSELIINFNVKKMLEVKK